MGAAGRGGGGGGGGGEGNPSINPRDPPRDLSSDLEDKEGGGEGRILATFHIDSSSCFIGWRFLEILGDALKLLERWESLPSSQKLHSMAFSFKICFKSIKNLQRIPNRAVKQLNLPKHQQTTKIHKNPETIPKDPYHMTLKVKHRGGSGGGAKGEGELATFHLLLLFQSFTFPLVVLIIQIFIFKWYEAGAHLHRRQQRPESDV